MKPLIDGDILRYEVGFAAQVGWQDEEMIAPPWWYVEDMLNYRIEEICVKTKANEPYQIYISGKGNFRDNLAKVKPYKGNRKENKPWHFNNLTVYMRDVLGAIVVNGIEADDRMTVDHIENPDTIICSRDKDLRQVPGWLYSWELGKQPEYGPHNLSKDGEIFLDEKGKIVGHGLMFFYSQLLTGDVVDNIPGIPRLGPVRAYEILNGSSTPEDAFSRIKAAYLGHYGDAWERELLEQGRLLWMTRRLHEDGSPVLWEIGMTE